MAEIKKYLENHEAEKKKKILVVDDSDVMLQAMKRLLEDTYEVSLAKSGLAAIRSMTLESRKSLYSRFRLSSFSSCAAS